MLAIHLFGVAEFEFLNKIKLTYGYLDEKKQVSDTDKKKIVENNESREHVKEDMDNNVDSAVYEKKWRPVIVAVLFIIIFGFSILINYYIFDPEVKIHAINYYFNYIKIYVVMLILICAALIDYKKKIIPNKIIVTGLLFRLIIYILELAFCREIIIDIAKNDFIGFAIGFGVLFFAGIISKGAVGFGDAKLFAVIGLVTGYYCTLSTLFFGLLASAIASIVLLAKYHDKKRAFAFAPFILMGYLLVLAMGNF